MPQVQLPLFPDGITEINANLGFKKENGQITYFNGLMPVFIHEESDLNTFRMITSQFYVNGNATQAEICRAFSVPPISIKRAVKKYRESGPAGFYETRKTRDATVLTAEVIEEIQALLNAGESVSSVSKQLQIKKDTLNKPIRQKRLHRVEKKVLKRD